MKKILFLFHYIEQGNLIRIFVSLRNLDVFELSRRCVTLPIKFESSLYVISIALEYRLPQKIYGY